MVSKIFKRFTNHPEPFGFQVSTSTITAHAYFSEHPDEWAQVEALLRMTLNTIAAERGWKEQE